LFSALAQTLVSSVGLLRGGMHPSHRAFDGQIKIVLVFVGDFASLFLSHPLLVPALLTCLSRKLLIPSLLLPPWCWPRTSAQVSFQFLHLLGQEQQMEILLSQHLLLIFQLVCQDIGHRYGMAKPLLHLKEVGGCSGLRSG
jgi:hypothetical protein